MRSKKPRCPYFSRAYLAQCDKDPGHDGWCSSMGDGFAPGWDPAVQPDPLGAWKEASDEAR